MDKIIFFHMNQLGDLLFSLPVLKAARQKYPNIKIYCVARKNLANLLESTKLVDKIFLKVGSLGSEIDLIADIRKENIDTAVLFSESPETLLLAYFSKIKNRIGFKTASLSFLLTEKVEKIGVPSLNNNIVLAKAVGLDNVQKDYLNILNIDRENDVKVSFWLEDNGMLNKDFIIVSFGASRRRQEKCLRKEVWIETLNKLAQMKKNVVVVCAAWEKESVMKIMKYVSKDVKLFCPENGLVELSAMISKAKMFIGIDSGTMHLAASLGIKCIALYGNTDPSQIGPRPLQNHIIIKKNSAKDIIATDILENVK
ncbi:glycosyltransferase family 9 protein [Candidatus Ruminimicrobiellum ovillum]|uniref:glycosyltransferase family 9 protein n=1 Tax=Candidatus Ruminimicrobiellum ovillum TaxID=1947927 RepID=UPI00355AA9A5